MISSRCDSGKWTLKIISAVNLLVVIAYHKTAVGCMMHHCTIQSFFSDPTVSEKPDARTQILRFDVVDLHERKSRSFIFVCRIDDVNVKSKVRDGRPAKCFIQSKKLFQKTSKLA
jgi:hypothetical protein